MKLKNPSSDILSEENGFKVTAISSLKAGDYELYLNKVSDDYYCFLMYFDKSGTYGQIKVKKGWQYVSEDDDAGIIEDPIDAGYQWILYP